VLSWAFVLGWATQKEAFISFGCARHMSSIAPNIGAMLPEFAIRQIDELYQAWMNS